MHLPTLLAQHIVRRPQRIALLQHIAEQGSITAAAKSAGISYKAAWDAIDELNNLAQTPLVERSIGGKGGGGARLSVAGERVLRLYQRLQALQAQVLDAAEDAQDLDLLGRLMLRTSARNQLHGTVIAIHNYGHNDLIELELPGALTLRANYPRQHPAPGTGHRQPGSGADQSGLVAIDRCRTAPKPRAQSPARADRTDPAYRRRPQRSPYQPARRPDSVCPDRVATP